MINFRINQSNQTDTFGSFELEPLEKGFGHTVGNCLKRVLLTSLEGTAISFVKIEGVSHQFSTVPGISEDVIQIILNLKKVRLTGLTDKPFKMKLQASGKGEVKAGQIDTLGNAEVVNSDLHIAFLNTPSAKLTIEMTAEKGVGYVPTEEKKNEEIGVIPIDSIFTPILSVVYKVEPTRVGRSADYDKLTLEIMSDGTIKPADALNKAAQVLSAYFQQIYEPTFDEEIISKPSISDDVLKLSVEELDLPVRITNALKAVEIDTVGKLTTIPKVHLMKAKNLGVQSLNLISQKLSERGLTLSEA